MASGQRQFQMQGRSMNVKKEGKVGSNGKGGPKFYYIKSTRGGTKGLKRETASLPKLLQASLLQCSASSSSSRSHPHAQLLCLCTQICVRPSLIWNVHAYASCHSSAFIFLLRFLFVLIYWCYSVMLMIDSEPMFSNRLVEPSRHGTDQTTSRD